MINERNTSLVDSVGETASSVLRTFQTIHGCRPISPVHHPAIVAISARKTVDTQIHKSHRGIGFSRRRRRRQTNHATTPIIGNRNPRSIIAW